jgi:hypothetical protein
MATGAILCRLMADTYAVMRIAEEIEALGFTPEQVATTFGVMAGECWWRRRARGRMRSSSLTACLAGVRP